MDDEATPHLLEPPTAAWVAFTLLVPVKVLGRLNHILLFAPCHDPVYVRISDLTEDSCKAEIGGLGPDLGMVGPRVKLFLDLRQHQAWPMEVPVEDPRSQSQGTGRNVDQAVGSSGNSMDTLITRLSHLNLCGYRPWLPENL